MDADGGPAALATYRKLRDSLQRGVFVPGDRLPGERDLAGRLQVSRATLRQALGRLAEEGRLQRSAQRGWFVPRPTAGEPPSTLQSFTEMARSLGLTAQSRMLHRVERRASPVEVRALRVGLGARVVELRRLRSTDGEPICVDTSVVVLDLVPGLSDVDMTDRSLYDTIEELSAVRIARSSYTVRAAASDAETAVLLEIPPGSPILIGEEITYATDGTPILAGSVAYRADAYRFRADLFRPL